jgi:adenosylcobinamide kinase/adenosylcobinamide-phosphate guanylyltransferase
MICFISGGERSGKSSFAQNMALEISDQPVYVATARNWDNNFDERIEKHKDDRDERWTTIEEEKYIGNLDLQGKTVVIDCVTLWLTNFYVDTKYDVEESVKLAKIEIDKLAAKKAEIFIVSNEIGMGVHASTETARKFTELQGWVNQYIAKKSGKAYLMVSGLHLKLK